MAWKHAETADQRGYGWHWRKLRERILSRDCGLCQPCERAGRLTPASQVDHITRKEDGGTDDESNLQAICRACHDDKTMREKGHKPRRAIGVDGWPV